MSSTDHLRSPL